MIIANIAVTNDNAGAIQHALELALARGTYTPRERQILQGAVDDILLARLHEKPVPLDPVAQAMADALRAILVQVVQGKVLERDACIGQARNALKAAGALA